MVPIANARMYSVSASAKADWQALLSWALHDAGLDWPWLDHDAPTPLSALWSRDDLGLAMMCGLPYSQRTSRPTLVAAPLPLPARYGRRPVYFTDLVVSASSEHPTLEDTFGGVVGYTLADSMSGGVALRHHLARYRNEARPRLYRRSVGNLIHARGVIEAIVDGRIDVGPLDSYSHDLLALHEPALAAQVRTLASTDAMPIPPLVATAALASDELARLRSALRRTAEEPLVVKPMARLLLAGFAFPEPADYDCLATIAATDTTPFEDLR